MKLKQIKGLEKARGSVYGFGRPYFLSLQFNFKIILHVERIWKNYTYIANTKSYQKKLLGLRFTYKIHIFHGLMSPHFLIRKRI